jgi:hypothetical protein
VTRGGCGVCGGDNSTAVTVTDDDGGVAARACEACLDRLVEGAGCAVCGEATSGEYHVLAPPEHGARYPEYRLCSGCRRRWGFDNTEPLRVRLDRLGVARFGGGGR